ncbi:MAG: heme biosynthesis HemY N-terminal domain-containing protein, partial [Kiloniellales bacterium]
DTSVGILVLAVAILAAAAAAAYRFWRTLREAPRALAEAGRSRRQSRGSRALARAMAAVAAGEAEEAVRLARRADNLLDDPGLTLPLKAQAARLSGDEAAARRCYEAMAANESTAFVGISGLLGLARKAGDTDQALRLARPMCCAPTRPGCSTTCSSCRCGPVTGMRRWRP